MVLTLVFVKKGCSLAFLVVIVTVIVIVCGATSTSTSTSTYSSHKKIINLFKSQYSSSCSNGSNIGECRMDEEQLELPMDPEISRRLLGENGGGEIIKTLDPGAAVGAECDRGPYGSCLPGANGDVNDRCQPYQRCRIGSS